MLEASERLKELDQETREGLQRHDREEERGDDKSLRGEGDSVETDEDQDGQRRQHQFRHDDPQKQRAHRSRRARGSVQHEKVEAVVDQGSEIPQGRGDIEILAQGLEPECLRDLPEEHETQKDTRDVGDERQEKL